MKLHLSRIRKRLLFTYTLAFLIPYFAFIVSTYVYTQRETKTRTDERIFQSMQNTITDISWQMDTYSRISSQIQNDFSLLTSYPLTDFTSADTLKTNLHKLIVSHADIQDLWYYYEGDPYLVSARSSSDIIRFQEKHFDLTGAERELLFNSEDKNVSISCFDLLNWTECILWRETIKSKTGHNILLIYQLQTESFRQMLEHITDLYGGVCLLTDAQENVICSAPNSYENADRTAVVESFRNETPQYTSSDRQWKLRLYAPNTYDQGLMSFPPFFVAVVMGVLGLGIAYIFMADNRNYSPIRALRSQASNLLPESSALFEKDDFEFIGGCIEQAEKCILHTQETLRSYEDGLQDYLLFSLFRGKYASNEIFNRDTRQLSISLHHNTYMILVIKGGDLQFLDSCRDILSSIVGECDLLKRIDALGITLLIAYSEADSQQSLNEVIQQMAQFAHDSGLQSGFSKPICSLLSLGYAYLVALYAANSYDLQMDHPLPDSLTGLVNAIEENNIPKMKMLLAEIRGNKYNIPHDVEAFSTLALQSAILTMPLEVLEPEMERLISVYQHPSSVKATLSILETILEKPSANNASTHESPIESMYRYIDSHYDSPSFSLKEMAYNYSMSLAQLSGLFKRETNIALNDYITELKLGKAKYLLEHTDMPVNEIGMAVGYVNSGSFVRRFKQVTGDTPGKYRSDHNDSLRS